MAPSSDVTEFKKVLESSKNIIVLSGAGLSAPSGMYKSIGHEVILFTPMKFRLGIATYRGASNSLWSDPVSNSVFCVKIMVFFDARNRK